MEPMTGLSAQALSQLGWALEDEGVQPEAGVRVQNEQAVADHDQQHGGACCQNGEGAGCSASQESRPAVWADRHGRHGHQQG